MSLRFEVKEKGRLSENLSIKQKISLLDRALIKSLARTEEALEQLAELELTVEAGVPPNATMMEEHRQALTTASERASKIEKALLRLRQEAGEVEVKTEDVPLE